MHAPRPSLLQAAKEALALATQLAAMQLQQERLRHAELLSEQAALRGMAEYQQEAVAALSRATRSPAPAMMLQGGGEASSSRSGACWLTFHEAPRASAAPAHSQTSAASAYTTHAGSAVPSAREIEAIMQQPIELCGAGGEEPPPLARSGPLQRLLGPELHVFFFRSDKEKLTEKPVPHWAHRCATACSHWLACASPPCRRPLFQHGCAHPPACHPALPRRRLRAFGLRAVPQQVLLQRNRLFIGEVLHAVQARCAALRTLPTILPRVLSPPALPRAGCRPTDAHLLLQAVPATHAAAALGGMSWVPPCH